MLDVQSSQARTAKFRPGAALVLTAGLAAASAPLIANAADASFSSRADAEAYIAKTLPAETATNPKYLTRSSGVETVWLVKTVDFVELPGGALKITMDEDYIQTKDGKTTPNTHKAAFALADVDVAENVNPDDVTPTGEPARGVIFNCTAPKCIAAHWGDYAMSSDKTDVYLREPDVRAKVLAAFLYLKGAH